MKKSVFLMIVFFPALAWAQSSDNFRRGRAKNIDNRDSVISGSISMNTPNYAGSGCPQGSINATLSPDSKSLSILYDSFILELGDSVGVLREKKTCQLRIPVRVPRGVKATVVAIDYRGYHFLEADTGLRLQSKYFFQSGGNPGRGGGVTTSNMVVNGPIDDEYIVSTELRQYSRGHSSCGQNFILNVVNDLHGFSKGGDLFATVDSLDAVGRAAGDSEIRYHLKWEACSDEADPGRRRGGNNDHHRDRPGRGPGRGN